MCGRYSLAAPDPDELRARFGVGESLAADPQPRYNIAPSQEVLAVTAEQGERRRARMLRWGLVPPFMKEAAGGAKMINARAETVPDKPAYRGSFQRHRCLIPADGFYEWARRPESDAGRAAGRPTKQPFHITVRGEPLFAFAGLWATWHRGREDELATMTILTTAANAAMAPIHDRMPVILTRAQEQLWLDPETPRPVLEELMRGLAAECLILRPVSGAVNSPRNDGPECLAPPAEPAASQRPLF